MATSWIKHYEPQSVKDIEGQDAGVKQIIDFVQNFKTQKKRALLIYGPTGCGKTVSAYGVANDLDLELLEVNASDFRNADKINSIIGSATSQMSLFAKGKLILVDEIDGLSGKKDRGGIAAITKIIEKSSFPMILTAQDPFDKKFSTLRKKATVIEFEALDYISVFKVLERIAKVEQIKTTDEIVKALARRSGGDLRAAINDLQTLAQSKKSLTKEDLDDLSQRRRIESIPQALVKVLKSTQADIARRAFDDINEDFDQRFLWIDENLPREYTKPEDLVRAYNYLSKADVFRGRIRRWQHWRFLVYINDLLTAGIATAKDEKYKTFVNFQRPKRILKIWMANMKYQKRKAIAEKIADATHTSKKRALQDTLPYMKVIFQKNHKMAEALAEEFDLDPDEVTWLKK